MQNIFLTSETNYWNKGTCMDSMKLDSYFRVPRNKDSYITVSPRYENIMPIMSVDEALTNIVCEKKLSKEQHKLLSQHLQFTMLNRSKTVKITMKRLFKEYIEWMGKEYFSHKINGGILNHVIKPFNNMFDILKRQKHLCMLQIQSNKESSVSQALFQKFNQIKSKRYTDSSFTMLKHQEIDEDEFELEFTQRSKLRGKVLKEADRWMNNVGKTEQVQRKSKKKFTFRGESSASITFKKSHKKVEVQKNNGYIDQNGLQSPTSKKVKFVGEDLQDGDNEQQLCKELQLLIKKTEEILKPKEEQHQI